MPELPEVETMVRDLAPRLAGRTITAIEAPFTGSVVYPSFFEFEQRVVGRTIGKVTRRGKYAIFGLSSGDLLIMHRGMSGTILLRPQVYDLERWVRMIFRLDDASELRFQDPRKFGKVFVMQASGEERPFPWATMGPEPLNGDFTPKSLRDALRARKGLLKPLLLNQKIVAGLGNIYVDEALFLARVHPGRPAGSLTPAETKRLHAAIRQVLGAAIDSRGTTFSSYADIEGRSGGYQTELRVFRNEGTACPRCARPIVKTVVGGRGTHFCPRCQRL